MTQDMLEGQWTLLKETVREQWGKLTRDDVDEIRGRSEQLIGKLQQRYGVAREEAQWQFRNWAPKVELQARQG